MKLAFGKALEQFLYKFHKTSYYMRTHVRMFLSHDEKTEVKNDLLHGGVLLRNHASSFPQ